MVCAPLVDHHIVTAGVLVTPSGPHDSLVLWVQPAPDWQEWPNANMLLHVGHLLNPLVQWSEDVIKADPFFGRSRV